MNEAPKAEFTLEPERHLLPFGVGGDYIGARRARRAFRLLVFATLGLTASLYFSEHYLRYGMSEVQYRMALTHEDDSQRAILRNVVRRDAEDHDIPTPKYVAALAYIEEEDLVLERYAQAIELAPDDTELLTVYGCKLFQMGDHKGARRIFRDAGLKTTDNALPDYLQAAAIAASSSSEEDFRTAVALIARTNDSKEAIVFPKPLWHDSLPRRGYWYYDLQFEMEKLCAAPLYTLKNIVAKRVQTELREGTGQGVESWIYPLQMLGERLVGQPGEVAGSFTTSRVLAGLNIQEVAVQLRQQVLERNGANPNDQLASRAAALRDAVSLVVQFEERQKDVEITRKRVVARPVYMAFLGAFLLASACLLAILLNRVFNTDRNARALRQTGGGIRALAAWILVLSLILFSGAMGAYDATLSLVASGLWVVSILVIIVIAFVYPALVLPSATSVCQSFVAEPSYSITVLEARRSRRRAYLSLAGRYLNIALGVYCCLLCVWVLSFRILHGLYPSDTKFLVDGLSTEVQPLVKSIFLLLN